MEVKTYQSAPLWRRFAAILYDSFLVLALIFLAGFINLGIQIAIYGEALLHEMTEQGYSLGGVPFYLGLIVIIYGFFGFFWTRSGQTLGMKAWRLSIVGQNGQAITPAKSLTRFLMAIPSLGLVGLGVFWMLLDPKQRSWQDMASSSQTILLPKAKQ